MRKLRERPEKNTDRTTQGNALSAEAGMERITGQILAEARSRAEEIRQKAAEEAEEIRLRARKELEQWEAQAEDSLARELEELRVRESSRREMERKRALLEVRQSILGGMIRKARRTMEEAEAEQYFSVLKKMFARRVRAGNGILYLSARDFGRMPEGFEKEIRKLAEAKNGGITLREIPGVDYGFLLVYGEVEENCTFRAMIDDCREELLDKAGRLLWGQ